MLEVTQDGGPFVFTDDNRAELDAIIAKYPTGRQRSAVMPALYLAQRQNGGWISREAVEHIAEVLDMPKIQVLEVATFYTMYNLKPIGRYHVQVCGTTPCWLCGSDEVFRACKDMGLEKGKTTGDGLFHLTEVECLGACVNAPMIQINDDYYEDLTEESLALVLDRLRNGAPVEPGPQNGRQRSEAIGGTDVLSDAALFDGSRNAITALPNLPTDTEAVAPEAEALPPQTPPTNVEREGTETAKEQAESLPGERPERIKPEDGSDDLKRIKGIGPKNEDQLNALGIFTFAQIAAWTPANVEWVEGYLSFPGRIGREDWIGQAKQLSGGGETEFSKRVDKGEVDSSKDGED